MITRFENSGQALREGAGAHPRRRAYLQQGADRSKLGPKFIARGKGCYVWDVDGNKYLGWGMGLTAVNLGHGYKPVLDAVKRELVKAATSRVLRH